MTSGSRSSGSRFSFQDFLPPNIADHPAIPVEFSGQTPNLFLVFVIESIQTARHIDELSAHSAVRGALALIHYVKFISAQRIALLAKGELFKQLVSKLMGIGRKDNVGRTKYHMKIVFQHHHWQVSEYMRHRFFVDGRHLYAQGQFSRAIQSWKLAAVMQDKVSHAIVADMLIGGRPGVPKDPNKAFEIASIGEIMNCVHSMGVLARCNLIGIGCSLDIEFGEALARYSAERGDSCFGWHAWGITFYSGLINQRDYAEAARCFKKAAAHDHAVSQTLLGYMHEKGIGVLRDYDKSLSYYERAATQRFDIAERNLGCLRDLISRMHNRGDRSDGD